MSELSAPQTPTPPEAAPPPAPRQSRSLAAIAFVRGAALLPVIGVLLVVGAATSHAFFTSSNLALVGQQGSALAVVVIGEALIIMIGGMDLSLESTFGFGPMLAALLMVPTAAYGWGDHVGAIVGILIVFVFGAVVGLVNGLAIVKVRLNGFIWTLGMTVVLGGAMDGISNGNSLFDLPKAFSWLGGASAGPISVSLIATLLIFIAVGLFLRYHKVGRQIYAIGGNKEAARAAGIRVDRVCIGVYVAGSVLASIGGLMEAGYVGSVAATQGYGEGIIFQVFAAAVIGGVSLKGGRGNMLGAFSGVALLALVNNILTLDNVNNYWILAIYGCVILVALFLARFVGGEAAAE
jgi:simple sugar transport system permease protein